MLPKLKPQPKCSPGGYPQDFGLFDRLSRDLPCELRRTWRRETDRDPTLESDSYGIATYAAVGLPRSINVRRLEIECRSWSGLLRRVIKGEGNETAYLRPPFPKLEKLSILHMHTNGRSYIGANDIAPFFRLPSLTKVRASGVILGDVDLSRLGTRLSSVSDIYIKDSLITKGMLQWLELCRGLKSFRTDFQGTRADIHAAPRVRSLQSPSKATQDHIRETVAGSPA